MKFLCVPCDSPMKLQSVAPPERGSLSVVYSCPECGYEMAMLTNAYETQVVQSLGVRIGPDGGHGKRRSTRGRPGCAVNCPFTAMIRGHAKHARGDARPAPATRPCPLDGRRGSPAREGFPSSSAPWRGPASSDSPESGAPSKWTRRILDAAREFFGM
jgi:hypothetical protein